MKIWLMLTLVVLSFTACTVQTVESLPYYKMPVVQGMPLDAEAIMSINVGMTRDQVELTLGKPPLRPAFRDNQWDYNYEVVRGNKIKEQRDFTVYFDGDRVSRVTGNALTYARERMLNKSQEIK